MPVARLWRLAQSSRINALQANDDPILETIAELQTARMPMALIADRLGIDQATFSGDPPA